MRESELVEVTAAVSVCRDPKDDKFLELALSGAATHIISGDDDLLALHPFSRASPSCLRTTSWRNGPARLSLHPVPAHL